MKRIMILLLSALMIFGVAPGIWAGTDISVVVNGERLACDQAPIIENDRVLVPMRAIFEALGAKVDWTEATQTVSASQGDNRITMNIGQCNLFQNGKLSVLDVAPKIVGDRTMVPVRAVSECFGSDVQWNPDTRTVTVDKENDANTQGQDCTSCEQGQDCINCEQGQDCADCEQDPDCISCEQTQSCGAGTQNLLNLLGNKIKVNTSCSQNQGNTSGNQSQGNTSGNQNQGNTSGNQNQGNTSGSQNQGNTSGGQTQSAEKRVLELVNEQRAKAGLNPLIWHDGLAAVARAHSKDMNDRGFMSHTNPDGLSPFDRIKNAGFSYSRAAENIAGGQKTPEAVMDAWMNSSGHRANIMNPDLKYLGVGLYEGNGTYKIYWTQNFMTP